MINARRIITISGTLFCALSAGFLMQHVLLPAEVEQRSQGVQVASVAAVAALPVTDMQPIAEQPYQTPTLDDAVDIAIEDVLLTAFVPIPPSAAPQPDLLPDTPVMLVALDDAPIFVLPREELLHLCGNLPALPLVTGDLVEQGGDLQRRSSRLGYRGARTSQASPPA